MSAPYRTADTLPEYVSEPPTKSLGRRRSSHFRKGLFGAYARAARLNPIVAVHDGGLVVWTGLEQHVVIPFDAIDAIYYRENPLLDSAKGVSLVAFDGVRIEIPDDVCDLEQILIRLRLCVTRPLERRAIEALRHGERMTFGPVDLELDGLRLRGDLLLWSEMSRVVFERDALVVYRRDALGRFGWVRLTQLPHIPVLAEVLRLRVPVILF